MDTPTCYTAKFSKFFFFYFLFVSLEETHKKGVTFIKNRELTSIEIEGQSCCLELQQTTFYFFIYFFLLLFFEENKA